MMTATQSPPPAAPALPPELERFWVAFATSQIRKGRRDIGAMVQAALEYLFERGTQRLKPLVRSQEDFETFRAALIEEFARIGKALSTPTEGALAGALAGPYDAKQFRIVRREDDAKPASDAVQVTALPRPLSQRDELERYRVALDKQFNATLAAIEENTKRLMDARQGLQAQLVPYSPAFYNVATQLLADFDRAAEPTPGLVKPGDEAGLVPTHAQPHSLMQRMGQGLLERLRAGLVAKPAAAPSPGGQAQFERWVATLHGDAPSTGLAPTPTAPPALLVKILNWIEALLRKKR